ncbi:MAG: DNA gyrase subunit A [Candidatus Limivicinus sp.]|nr:topoisomerase IV [Clostridiales bacterium]MDY6132294.1 DNA gyrase subunit A [Candidatus Limivicinus sp.]
MAKKKETEGKKYNNPNVMGLKAQVLEQPITETLETNYMPYAMSVIVSRAIPEIDGFKPSHRKLLYTMFKMGLLTGARTKSANIVGQTMKLNPHGDAAIYETMVRLSAGYEALLTPFVDSKGNFGKVYSRDMSYAASRYTEAKLSAICAEVFRDIDKDTVDFVDNYDGSMMEPTLLPTAFPNVLVSANSGIAVGMASMICGFNLNEVCETTINYLRDPEHDLFSTLPAPDFPTGGEIIYDRAEMESIYNTGRGSFKVRARWRYLQKENIIEIFQIPYTTTSEAIIDKVAELIKAGKIREINDMRDETDLGGLRLAIDLKRGVDPEKLMQKLFKMTTLQDAFPCNFNILIAGNPRVMGVREILDEWTAWRMESIRRRVYHELEKKREKLHLLQGLGRILLDIDKAIEIIRGTELESEVVPNLMMGFGIDQIQAEFVAEIKLRNINREYILKRTAETEALEKDIEELESILNSRRKIKGIIIDELKQINKKYVTPRKSTIVYADEIQAFDEEQQVEDYPVTLFLSKEGYFKKITAQSLRMSGEQKYKDGDRLNISFESTNRGELLFLTDRQQMYKARVSDFEDVKASVLGVYLPSRLQMDEGENIITMIDPGDYKAHLLFFFENGKAARVELSAYETKTNRKKLVNAYSDKSPLCSVIKLTGETDLCCFSSDDRALVFNSSLLQPKTSRSAQGVAVMSLKARRTLDRAKLLEETQIKNVPRYRVRSLPAAGALLRPEDREEQQMSLIEE